MQCQSARDRTRDQTQVQTQGQTGFADVALKRKGSCSICRGTGHNRTTCSSVASQLILQKELGSIGIGDHVHEYCSDDNHLAHAGAIVSNCEYMLDESFTNDEAEDPDDSRIIKTQWAHHAYENLPAAVLETRSQDPASVALQKLLPTFGGSLAAKPSYKTPLECCELFISTFVVYTFHKSTNEYAKRTQRLLWKDVDEDEMRLFLCIVLLLSQCNYPRPELAWDDEIMGNNFIRSQMEKNRFVEIFNCWCWKSDCNLKTTLSNCNIPNSKPYYAVDGFLEAIRGSCKAFQSLGQCYSIGEMVIPVSSKCKLPLKSHRVSGINRWDIQVICLNDSKTSFLADFIMHNGESAEDAVLRLTECPAMHNKHHVLAIKSSYTSVPLALSLQERGIDMVGTIRATRKFIPSAVASDWPCGTVKHMVWEVNATRKLFFSAWKDRNKVHMLSSFSPYATNARHDDCDAPINRTTIVQQFNLAIGGTDNFVQLVSNFHPIALLENWSVRVFTHFIACAAVNAYIMYKRDNKLVPNECKYTLFEFVSSIARETIMSNDCGQTIPKNLKRSDSRVVGAHTPVHKGNFVCPNSGKQNEHRRTCVICRKRVTYVCFECNAPLCIVKDGLADPSDSCWHVHHATVSVNDE